MLQYNVVTALPLLMPERLFVRSLPPAYNEDTSPYRNFKKFSEETQRALDQQQTFKLRPCKVIFVGDVAVGKTTIVNRFCYDKFQVPYKATIGVDFEIENFNVLGHNFCLEISQNMKVHNITVWDTAGQERFKSIAQAYYRNANVVVVFDMSKPETMQSVTTWLKNALMVNSFRKPLIFLVGTKSDLLDKEEFVRTEKMASEIAVGIKAEYWSMSARTGYNVVNFFHRIAALSFETALKDAIVNNRKYVEKSIRAQMKKESDHYYFRKFFRCEKKCCGTDKSFCLC